MAGRPAVDSAEDHEQRAADVSVDHPRVVGDYREGQRLARASADGDESTERLRQAMRHTPWRNE